MFSVSETHRFTEQFDYSLPFLFLDEATGNFITDKQLWRLLDLWLEDS